MDNQVQNTSRDDLGLTDAWAFVAVIRHSNSNTSPNNNPNPNFIQVGR